MAEIKITSREELDKAIKQFRLEEEEKAIKQFEECIEKKGDFVIELDEETNKAVCKVKLKKEED